MRKSFSEFRMLVAEKLLDLAISVAPDRHPDKLILVDHVRAYTQRTIERMEAQGRGTPTAAVSESDAPIIEPGERTPTSGV